MVININAQITKILTLKLLTIPMLSRIDDNHGGSLKQLEIVKSAHPKRGAMPLVSDV